MSSHALLYLMLYYSPPHFDMGGSFCFVNFDFTCTVVAL